MKSALSKTLINSTLAFVSAFFITTIIHESGHFLSYWLFGARPVLFHNYVYNANQSLALIEKVISSLAGPLISLIQGVGFWLVFKFIRKNNAFQLLFLWLALLGFVNFFGYLVMTPVSTAGDTGKVAELLKFDEGYRLLIAIVGMLVLILLMLKLGRHFNRFIPDRLDMKGRRKYVYFVMFLPIVIGSVVNTLFSFPVPVALSVIYPATSSLVIMSSFGAILRSGDTGFDQSGIGTKINISLVLITLALIAINRLLTMGLE